MRLKLFVPMAAAFFALVAVGSPARAAHCGASAYSAACCPQDCCYPQVRYKTCWQTVTEEVTKICYKPVYKTVMKECRYTVCKPVYETIQKECRYTVCKPVWEVVETPVTYKVCKPVWEEGVREVKCCSYKLVKETVERECVRKVCKPVTEMKTVACCVKDYHYESYCVPGRKKLRLWKEPGCCTVDPCTGCTKRSWGRLRLGWCQGPPRMKCRKVCTQRIVHKQVPVTRYVTECVVEKIPVTICKRVPVYTVKKIPYKTCKYVMTEETKVVKCRKCRIVREEVVKTIPVRVCKYVQEEVVKQVPVTVCEKVPVEVKVNVCKRVPVQVAVCDSGRGFGLGLGKLFSIFHGHKSCGGCDSCDSCCGH